MTKRQMKMNDEEFMINIWKSDDVLKISVDDKQDLAMNEKRQLYE